jgi:hypothetical protein
VNTVVLAALAAWRRQQWQSRSNSVTLGVIWASVTLEIAAGDEVDKKGSFEDQLLYIKKYLTLRPGQRAQPLSGC